LVAGPGVLWRLSRLVTSGQSPVFSNRLAVNLTQKAVS
jgi:hypothetical protein